jgi:integrase
MRLAHHLLRHVSGVFHFRLIVPTDLQPLLGRRVIKKSLGTRDPTLARWWAYTLGARYAQLFATARSRGSGMAKEPKEGDPSAPPVEKRDVKLRTGSGVEVVDYDCEIRADGSMRLEAKDEADHVRMMAALKAAKECPAWLAQGPLPSAPTRSPDTEGLVDVMERLAHSLSVQAATSAASAPIGVVAPSRPRAIGLAADQWLKSIEGETLRKTMTIKSAAIMGFARHVGMKKLLHEVQREDVHAWVEALRTSGLQTPTLVNKTSYLRGFFTWAVQAGHYPKFPKDENPAMGHVVFRKREKLKRKAMGFRAFTQEQIQTLYAPEALAKLSEGARWGALIGLYTGARVSEVGQLALVDFTVVDGVPCLTITDEGEGQSIKNEASRRTIPIHPDLLTLGLMERVEQLRKDKKTRLFPKVKIGAVNGQGQWLSKAFSRHIEAGGITKPPKGKYGFHSLRKTAIQTMKSAKVPLEWRCAYVGHDLDEEHVETYSGEYGPRQMLETVAPGLSWDISLSEIRHCISKA